MKMLPFLLIGILQLIVGSLLGFTSAILLRVGNSWELVVFVVGYSLGVWGIGAFASRFLITSLNGNIWVHLGTTLLVSALGVLILVSTPAIGFIKAAYPMVGAMIGYYLPSVFLKKHPLEQT